MAVPYWHCLVPVNMRLLRRHGVRPGTGAPHRPAGVGRLASSPSLPASVSRSSSTIIPRPGLASGLFVNTRSLSAIVSGAVISFGSLTPLGYGGVFAVCAGFTALALVAISVAARITKRDGGDTPKAETAPNDGRQRHL